MKLPLLFLLTLAIIGSVNSSPKNTPVECFQCIDCIEPTRKQCKTGDKCFTYNHYTNDAKLSLYRGCFDDLSKSEKELCLWEKDDCFTCEGNYCNFIKETTTRQPERGITCYKCNSEDDLNCAWSPGQGKVCKDPEGCFQTRKDGEFFAFFINIFM